MRLRVRVTLQVQAIRYFGHAKHITLFPCKREPRKEELRRGCWRDRGRRGLDLRPVTSLVEPTEVLHEKLAALEPAPLDGQLEEDALQYGFSVAPREQLFTSSVVGRNKMPRKFLRLR